MGSLLSFVIFILVGAAAGWLAGKLVNAGGKGFLLNIIVGIIGALLGGWLLQLVGISWHGLFGQFCTSVLGAAVLLILLSLFKK